jgi:Tfp pilus assembly protein PilF
MKWILSISLLFLVNCVTTNASHPNKDAESAELYLQLGTNQLQKGFTAQALGTFLKGEQLDAKNMNLQNYLGMTYFILKQNKLAIEHFQKAVTIDPKFSEARNNMARVLIEMGRFKEAHQEIKRVLDDLTYGQQNLALTNLALLYVREKNYKSAIPYLQKSIRLDKTNCLTYSLYARSLYELGDLKAALPVFDAALPLCRRAQVDEAHFYAAMAYYKSGDHSRGIGLMNETILFYPDGEFQAKAKANLELMRLNRL